MPPSHEPLLTLVASVEAALHASGDGDAVIRVSDIVPRPERATWIPLDGAHPLEVLLGFVAPPHWRALGVAFGGRARRLAPGDRVDVRHLLDGGGPEAGPPAGRDAGPDAGPDAEDVVATVLVDRSGIAVARLRRGSRVEFTATPPEGTIADACRRALGLPTAPPPASTLGLWHRLWLDRLVAVAAARPPRERPRTWAEVAARHPAGGARPAAPHPTPVALAALARSHAAAWPWARLRDQPHLVVLPGPPLRPTESRWMDDGMFARWVSARLPGEDDLLAAVHALLAPGLARGVELVVRPGPATGNGDPCG